MGKLLAPRSLLQCTYYLRTQSNYPVSPCALRAYLGLNWVMVVVYMDRAQGPTVDCSTQNFPVTLP